MMRQQLLLMCVCCWETTVYCTAEYCKSTLHSALMVGQSINVYLYSPISQMLHLSQWTSQFVQNISTTIRHPLSLDPHIGQGKTPQFKGENGRNLRESNRGGIPLPGRTDVQ